MTVAGVESGDKGKSKTQHAGNTTAETNKELSGVEGAVKMLRG